MSALGGHLFTTDILWVEAAMFAIPVLAGGYFGSRFGVNLRIQNSST